MLSAGVMSSKACIAHRPAAFVAPRAAAPRMGARKLVVAEAEAEAAETAKKAKAVNLRCDMWLKSTSAPQWMINRCSFFAL